MRISQEHLQIVNKLFRKLKNILTNETREIKWQRNLRRLQL